MAIDSLRPDPAKRTFTSPVIEQVIADTTAQMADPELAWLFENCLPNTLDTTVFHVEDNGSRNPDTFIITGDIDAMWLRDSTNQVWPYLAYAKECTRLRELFRGLIRRQVRCVLLDPYANAFYRDGSKVSQWKSDHTEMKPGVHERKYELDSLASVLRLATGYFQATGDRTPFDSEFYAALDLILKTITDEQAGTPEQVHPHYSFARVTANATDTLSGGGHGNPCRRTGMSRSPFRPSDDAGVFQYHIPANAMASVMLQRTSELIKALRVLDFGDAQDEKGLRADLKALEFKAAGLQIKVGIEEVGTVHREQLGWHFAYEVDGFGSCLFMDDANAPNLLSLPYFGYISDTHDVYRNTRKLILSDNNPYFHKGSAVPQGAVGGPHIGMGWVWPLGIIMQAMTSTDDAEILACLHTLKSTHAGTGFMHEAFWMNDASRFTRHWFAWANTFFGEMILKILRERPALLKRELI